MVVWTAPARHRWGGVQRSIGFEALSVGPWKPLVGRPGDLGGVAQNPGQVVERVFSCELAGVDEAQEHIPHVSAVFGFEEKRVIAE